jgi:hypothetical protein
LGESIKKGHGRRVALALVSAIIILGATVVVVFVALQGQISALHSQVTSLQSQLDHYMLPVDTCDKLGNGDCDRALASLVEQNPRFIQTENGTDYSYEGDGGMYSNLLNGTLVMYQRLQFGSSEANVTQDLYVDVPLGGGSSGSPIYYDIADISFVFVSKEMVVIPPALQFYYELYNATASFDIHTSSWHVVLEGRFTKSQAANFTEVYALTSTGIIQNLSWAGVSPIGSSLRLTSPLTVASNATFEIDVTLETSQGFTHGELVYFVVSDSNGDTVESPLNLP